MPFVKNTSADPLELPGLGVVSTPPGGVVEVDDATAAALAGHPYWADVEPPESPPSPPGGEPAPDTADVSAGPADAGTGA